MGKFANHKGGEFRICESFQIIYQAQYSIFCLGHCFSFAIRSFRRTKAETFQLGPNPSSTVFLLLWLPHLSLHLLSSPSPTLSLAWLQRSLCSRHSVSGCWSSTKSKKLLEKGCRPKGKETQAEGRICERSQIFYSITL